jgi:hypothetical protein
MAPETMSLIVQWVTGHRDGYESLEEKKESVVKENGKGERIARHQR